MYVHRHPFKKSLSKANLPFEILGSTRLEKIKAGMPISYGNPAVFGRPVAFRPPIPQGLAL
jgi:hypothetical protein